MSYLIKEGNRLNYDFLMPESGQCKCCVIFVHAAEGNKLGPHRMFVEFARILSNNGIASFRFDLTGCGDSTGSIDYGQDENVSDIDCVVRFLVEEKGVNNIVLLGISRGSHSIFRYMQTCLKPLEGVILLSLPASNLGIAGKAFAYRIKEYMFKLASRKTYIKFFKNQINYRLVLRTIFQVFSNKQKYTTEKTGTLFNCPVLLIYAEKDPVMMESKKIYLPLFESMSSDVRCEIIDGANHSFFHYKWKDEIADILLGWLEERFN